MLGTLLTCVCTSHVTSPTTDKRGPPDTQAESRPLCASMRFHSPFVIRFVTFGDLTAVDQVPVRIGWGSTGGVEVKRFFHTSLHQAENHSFEPVK